MRKTLILVACLLAVTSTAQALSWSDFDRLVGEWHGTGTQSGYTLTVTQNWERVWGGKFLRLTTHMVAIGEDGTEEIRENVGYMSFDNDRLSFVFRQFFSAGYVAAFDVLVENGGAVLDFGPREAESAGRIQARMNIEFTGNDTYVQNIDLANPREDFVTKQTLTMKR